MIETVLIIIVLAVPAIVLHECAHGWVAYRLGDPTAKFLGRLTLNPLKHVDPIGTVLVPAVLYLIHAFGWTKSLLMFGWAKPVPVNYSRLRNPKRDMMFVAMAGPLVNFLIAFLLIRLVNLNFLAGMAQDLLIAAVILNIGLACFNMIPIPPLDGSRIVMGLLPKELEKAYSSLEPFGIIIVIVLLNVGALDFIDGIIYGVASFMGLR
jgi:Zn-dependent protease